MKKIFITSLLLGLSSFLNADDVKKNEWMKDQQDQTDTYAVPLDSSEAEEKAEEEELESIKKKQPNQKGSLSK